MSDLQNLTPANTYKGLLQVGDYTNGVDSTVKAVLDGEGTASALAIGTTKVGIGTTSPTQELDVNGDIASTTLTASGAVTAGSVSTSGAVTGGSLDVSGNVVADEYALDQTGSSSSAVAIHAPATNELAIRTNSTEAMRIDSDGNVGIGTDSPDEPLHIENGSDSLVKLVQVLGASQSDKSHLEFFSKSGETETRMGRLGIQTDSDPAQDEALYLEAYDSNNVMFRAGSNTIMLITNDGNVGIGTVSPSAPLEVSSTTGGVIMPRMTTTQMNAISSPTDGEMIYNTTANKFYGRANGAWTALH